MSFFSYITLGDIVKKLCLLILMFLIFYTPLVNAFDSSATSTILMDMDSQKIIYAKNIHNVRSVASISKIMTAILAVESGKMNKMVTIGDEIKEAYGSGIYIQNGEKLKLQDLVYGLMLRSGNDAALAIAHYVGGDVQKFVTLMNEKAKEIGMKNTTFNNPSGLDEDKGNYSTAYDMAILTSYAMENELYRKIVGTKKYTLETNKNAYSWTNKNKLLSSYKYITGGKTGFTKKAKRTLVTTASKDNLNLVVVTLNDGNDWQDHQNLYEEAFQTYKSYQILKKGIIEIYDEKYYNNQEFYLKNNFSYPLLESEKNNIILKMELNKERKYKNNQKIGVVKVMIDNKEVHQEDIYMRSKQETKETFFSKLKRWITGND